MKKSILLLLVLYAGILGAQNSIDRLEYQLKHQADLSSLQRIELLNQLSREFMFISRTTAVKYAAQALQLSLDANDKKGEAYAYRNLAAVYYLQEQYFASAEFIQKALVLFEEMQDSVGIANCYITLGNTNRRRYNFGPAIEYHEKALEIFRRKNLPERVAVTLHNLASDQMHMGSLSPASETIKEAIHILEPLNDLPLLSACYRVRGMIAFKTNNLKEAKRDLVHVLEISDRLGEYSQKEATCESLLYLSRIAEAHDDDRMELEYIRGAIQLAKENHYQDLLRDAYVQYTDIHLRNKDFTKARESLSYYNSLQDSINRERHLNSVRLLETAMVVLKTSELNEQLQNDRELKDQIIKTQEKEILVFAVFLFCILLLALVLFYFYHQRRKHNKVLLHLNKIIREKSARLEKLNETKNKFFTIVAHDLKSPLNTLKSFVQLMNNHSDSISVHDRKVFMQLLDQNLNQTIDLADRLIEWARTQMETVETNPDKIQIHKIITDALQLYSSVIETKGISVHVDVPLHVMVFADPDHTEFICRNLIHNAVKFAPPHGRIRVSAAAEERKAILIFENTTETNGQNVEHLFVVGKVKSTSGTAGEKGTGLGLALCKEFVEANRGTIHVEQSENNMIRFSVEIPAYTRSTLAER